MPQVLTVEGLLEAYRSGVQRPEQVVEAVLARIAAAVDPAMWICTAPAERLRARAAELAAALRDGPDRALERFPLLGVPFAVKDNIDVAGLPTTAACPAFSYMPRRSAAAVESLEAAGALMVGKTNLDQFATGLVGTRSPYGEVSNPFDARYISGGSSSGSAAVTARGLVAFALGTDTAGSGRIPAGCCNLVGLKPTPGLVSNEGVFPACRSLDCVSVFAHTVADAWRVLGRFAYGAQPVLPLGPDHQPLVVGVPIELKKELDAAAWQAFSLALSRLGERAGIRVEMIDMTPFHEVSALLYEGPWVAERRVALGSFLDEHRASMDRHVAAIIGRADCFSAADAFRGQYRLAELQAQCQAQFDKIDLLLVPTMPAFYTREQIARSPIECNTHLGRYTNFVNLLRLCALAVPGPFRGDGLPAGVTLIGPSGADHRLAELARRWEPLLHTRLGTGTLEPPRRTTPLPPLPGSEPTVRLVVVGAHLSGLPLNWQLVERNARLLETTRTAPEYRLFALPGTTPPKPGLVRVASGGAAIEVEVWELPARHFGSFVALIPAPLAIGTVVLEGGRELKGFICEGLAASSAQDISASGGWRNYLRTQALA
ncbi:allophanate hydrolase [Azoarcus sp. DD4]|uniref:allophanate hydrolase n=1 Tax=Azoarcus sp. DD4 TaxID=2027405 RepID=UPI00197ADB4D|nr:allophanate hydrolase [Azoarcus sp. DD4]